MLLANAKQSFISVFAVNNAYVVYNDNDTKPALIESIKRKGGTYIYSNVPESMPAEVVNTILMQNKGLTGDCFLTYEHQNKTGLPYVYMGYRIVNNNDHDIYVTVKNVGYQVDGSWLGEKSWMDYYGVNFDMKRVASFDEKAYEWFDAYLHFDVNYKASPISPTTYKIPKGQYIYVIGGTSNDAYKNINVNDTANKGIKPNCCANANVFFTINNGKATGELCVYVDASKINDENVVIQNMRRYGENDDFGGRMGVSKHKGVIDNNPIWIFNDLTPSQNLPVKYYPKYADKLKDNYIKYASMTPEEKTNAETYSLKTGQSNVYRALNELRASSDAFRADQWNLQ